jgi:predicted acyl esterase
MSTKKPTDPKELLQQIEEQEREAFAEFERKQKEKREKALADIIEPLRKRRNEAAQQVNDLNSEIADLDKQIGSLTGQKPARQSSGKRRRRMTDDDKLKIARLMFGNLEKGKRYSAGDLGKATDGVPVREIVRVWNDANPKQKIQKEGNKATTRYFKE